MKDPLSTNFDSYSAYQGHEGEEPELFNDLPPCKDVCKYKFESTHGKYFDVITKRISCPNLMQRMRDMKPSTNWPPPQQVPNELERYFTQFGSMPVEKNNYWAQRYAGGSAFSNNWTPELLRQLRLNNKLGMVVGNYLKRDERVLARAFKQFPIEGKLGIILGSETPWVEAIALNAGAGHLITIEYGKINSTVPGITTQTPNEAGLRYIDGKFPLADFAVSYLSIQTSGLGRYGEALNPYGDLEAAAQIWCMLKPKGLFFLAAKSELKDHLDWNGSRIYGKERLKLVAASFLQHDVVWQGGPGQDIFVLEKPE